jgi:hypothetical protein
MVLLDIECGRGAVEGRFDILGATHMRILNSFLILCLLAASLTAQNSQTFPPASGLLLPLSAHVLGTNGLGQIVSSTTIPAADGNTSVQYNSAGLLAGDSTQFAWFEASIGTPTAPTVTQHGAAGAVTYAYQIVWLTLAGPGPGGAITTTTTGNATLSATNYNIITPPACPATASGYIVERTTDPGSNTGALPVIGVCGSPLNDVYGATYGALNQSLVTDLSTGFYASSITTKIENIGDNQWLLPPEIAGIYTFPSLLTVYADQSNPNPGAIEAISESSAWPVGITSMGIVHDAGTYGNGAYFLAAHVGSVDQVGLPGVGSLASAQAGLLIMGSGNVPGWSANYVGNEVAMGGGRFANVALVDCYNGTFVAGSTGTVQNACFHGLQAPIGGATIYFLLEEGGLPSKLAGSLTITPLKSTTGQRFVCVDNAGLLHSSTTACVGT